MYCACVRGVLGVMRKARRALADKATGTDVSSLVCSLQRERERGKRESAMLEQSRGGLHIVLALSGCARLAALANERTALRRVECAIDCDSLSSSAAAGALYIIYIYTQTAPRAQFRFLLVAAHTHVIFIPVLRCTAHSHTHTPHRQKQLLRDKRRQFRSLSWAPNFFLAWAKK